jgi:hypothetical protein
MIPSRVFALVELSLLVVLAPWQVAAQTTPVQQLAAQPALSNPDTRLTTGVETLSRASSAGTQHLLVDLMVTGPLGGKTTRAEKPRLLAWFNARFNGAANSSFSGVSQFVGGFEDRLVSGDVASVFNSLTFRAGLEHRFPGKIGRGTDFLGDYQVQATVIGSIGVVTVPGLNKPAIFEVSDEARTRWGIPASHPGKTTPITYVGLTEPDRRRFYPKFEVGLRIKTHHFINCTGREEPCDQDERVHFPGMVDFTLGQDASLTGGTLRGRVFSVDAFYPLPTDNIANAVYFFGRIRRHFGNVGLPVEQPPLILKAAAATVTIPSDDLWLHTLTADERTRDDWKVGFGVDLVRFFTLAVKKNTADAANAIADKGFSRPAVLSHEGIDVVRLLVQPGETGEIKHSADYFLSLVDGGRLDVINAKGEVTGSRVFEKHTLEAAFTPQRYKNPGKTNFEALLIRVKAPEPASPTLETLKVSANVTVTAAPGGSDQWNVSTVECTATCTVDVEATMANAIVIIPIATEGSKLGGTAPPAWEALKPIKIARKGELHLSGGKGTKFIVVRVR